MATHTVHCARCREVLTIEVTVDLSEVTERLDRIERLIKAEGDRIIMTTQESIDAATSAIQAVSADLRTAVDNVTAEVRALKDALAAAGTPVDTTALDAAVTELQGVQASVDGLETPAPVAPADATSADEPVADATA